MKISHCSLNSMKMIIPNATYRLSVNPLSMAFFTELDQKILKISVAETLKTQPPYSPGEIKNELEESTF